MGKFLKFLLVGFGFPMLAQQINHGGHSISKKLLLVSFLTANKKKIYTMTAVGLIGGILTICGLCLTAFSLALNADLQLNTAISATMIVSLSILLIGLISDVFIWRQIIKLEEAFELEKHNHQEETPSLTRTILDSVLHAFMGTPLHYPEHRNTLN